MRVGEFMTTNVVTVSSKTSIADAKRFMDTHGIRRLPVVDKGKLVGIVNDNQIVKASPSAATTLSIWEINYLLGKMTVGEVMSKSIITVTPNTTAESAIALAQKHRVGALPVLDNDHLVGIVTTNDFFYRFLNPLLGIGKPGVRLHIYDCGTARKIEEVLSFIDKNGLEIVAIHVDEFAEKSTRDLIVQVDTTDPSKLLEELASQGYTVKIRER